jgi:hypothetical protein
MEVNTLRRAFLRRTLEQGNHLSGLARFLKLGFVPCPFVTNGP